MYSNESHIPVFNAEALVAAITNSGNADNIWVVVLVADECSFLFFFLGGGEARKTQGTVLVAVSNLSIITGDDVSLIVTGQYGYLRSNI